MSKRPFEKTKFEKDRKEYIFSLNNNDIPQKSTTNSLNEKHLLDSFKKSVIAQRKQEAKSDFRGGAVFIEPILRIEDVRNVGDTNLETSGIKPLARGPKSGNTITLKDLAKRRGRIAIKANSGLGKTTLLKELQARVIKDTIDSDLIPVYFHFRDLLGVQSREDFLKRLADCFHAETPLTQSIEDLFAQKRFLFLFDGLDQVEDHNNIPRLVSLNGLLKDQSLIVAGRPHIFSSLANCFCDFDFYDVDTFTPTMAREYLGENRYTVLRVLLEEPSLRAPMLLAILRDLNLPKGNLINRTSIYQEMLDKMLEHEVQLMTIKSGPANLGYIRSSFAKLSFLLLDKGFISRFPWNAVHALLPELGISLGEFAMLTHLGIVSDIVEGSSLPDSDLVFRHQSFQEYLASIEFKRQLEKDLKNENYFLLKHMDFYKWDEVIFFTIGALDAKTTKPLIRYILDYDRELASRCLPHYRGDVDKDFLDLVEWQFTNLHLASARDILGSIASEGTIARLENELASSDISRRIYSAEILGKIGASRSADALKELLNDKNKNIRYSAAQALCAIGSEEAIGPLIQMIFNEEEGELKTVSLFLEKLSPRRIIPSLIFILKTEKDPGKRASAANILGLIESRSAKDDLARAVNNDSDPLVKRAAALALGRIGDVSNQEDIIPLLSNRDNTVKASAIEALGLIGSDKAVQYISRALKSTKKQTRTVAANALSKANTDEAARLLIKELDSENLDRRNIAVVALANAKRYEAGDIVLKKLTDGKISKLVGIISLGKLGHVAAVKPIVELMRSNEPDICWAGCVAISFLGCNEEEAVIRSLSYKEGYVQSMGAFTLSIIGTDRAIPPLLKCLASSDPDVRRSATVAIGDIGMRFSIPQAIEPLCAMLDDTEVTVAEAAATSIGQTSKGLDKEEVIRLLAVLEETRHFNANTSIKKAHKKRFLLSISNRSNPEF